MSKGLAVVQWVGMSLLSIERSCVQVPVDHTGVRKSIRPQGNKVMSMAYPTTITISYNGKLQDVNRVLPCT